MLNDGIDCTTRARPKCKRCGGSMWLEHLEPLKSGYEDRAYKCSSCDGANVPIIYFA